MSLYNYIQAMPKVELHVHLEGAFRKERVLTIAERNEIAEEVKNFDAWRALLDEPELDRIEETIETVMSWLQTPADLAHVVYELGLNLSKQNIRYAEINVNPIYFTENGWSFDTYIDALNDGRDRAQRGWDIQMRWILTVSREQPRHADEIVRWASSVSGQQAGIVAIDLGEPEDAQPVGQFERAFATAEKKLVPRAVHAGIIHGADAVLEVLGELKPNRLIDGWGTAESPAIRQALVDEEIPLNISLTKAMRFGLVETLADYPLQSLYDDGVTLLLGADMPFFYQSSLIDEYLAAVESCGLEVDELEAIALNAVNMSFMPLDDKAAMLESFKKDYERLRAEHLSEEPAE
jgi:adenosine deaminase